MNRHRIILLKYKSDFIICHLHYQIRQVTITLCLHWAPTYVSRVFYMILQLLKGKCVRFDNTDSASNLPPLEVGYFPQFKGDHHCYRPFPSKKSKSFHKCPSNRVTCTQKNAGRMLSTVPLMMGWIGEIPTSHIRFH